MVLRRYRERPINTMRKRRNQIQRDEKWTRDYGQWKGGINDYKNSCLRHNKWLILRRNEYHWCGTRTETEG
jgi:hypothetical protein